MTLINLLKNAWCEETAYNKWDPDNPAMNQCGVTSLLVHHVTGADIYYMAKENHFFNKLNGEVLDLTKDQFEYNLDYTQGVKIDPIALRVHPDTSKRFGILIGKIFKNLLHD